VKRIVHRENDRRREKLRRGQSTTGDDNLSTSLWFKKESLESQRIPSDDTNSDIRSTGE
jgi:hypothetical protein